MTAGIQVLHLHDQPGQADRLKATLASAALAVECRWVNSRHAFESALQDGWAYDLIFADHGLAGCPGPEALALARRLRPELPFLFLGPDLDPATVAARLDEGATECLGLEPDARVVHAVRRALDEGRLAWALTEAQAARTQTQTLLRTALEATEEGMVVVDLAGQVAAYNQPFLSLCGIPREVMATMDFHRILGFLQDQFQDPEAFLTQARLLAKPASPARTPFKDTRDGRILEGHYLPLAGPAQTKVLSVRLAGERQKEAPREGSRDALAQDAATHARAHLAPIQTRLRLLQDSQPLSPGQHTHLDAAAEGAARLEALLNRLADPQAPPAGALDVKALVEAARPRLEAALPQAIPLEVDLDPQTPPAALAAGPLEEVLMLLLANAREALGGSGRIRIRTGQVLGSGPTGAFLEVLDDGPGWPEAIQEQLFEPFFTTRPGAEGLGLWQARRLLAPYGATLEGDFQSGRGARFRVEGRGYVEKVNNI